MFVIVRRHEPPQEPAHVVYHCKKNKKIQKNNDKSILYNSIVFIFMNISHLKKHQETLEK